MGHPGGAQFSQMGQYGRAPATGAEKTLLPPSRTIWVGFGAQNASINEAVLEQAFIQCPGLINIRMMHGKGFAFLTYETLEKAQYAKSVMQGKQLHGATLRINNAKDMTGMSGIPTVPASTQQYQQQPMQQMQQMQPMQQQSQAPLQPRIPTAPPSMIAQGAPAPWEQAQPATAPTGMDIKT